MSSADRVLFFDVSGIGLEIRLAEKWADRLADAWRIFSVGRLESPFLRVRAYLAGDRPHAGPFDPKAMRAACTPERAEFELTEGSARVDLRHEAVIEVAGADRERVYWAFRNLLRACLAWSLPSRGAALLHGAALVIDERAFLLVGPEGSGKSTWAALGEGAGAIALGDDVVLIDREGDSVRALGTPLQPIHARHRQRRGRWPVAALLLPAHSTDVGLAEVAPLRVRASLLANLPFLNDAAGDDPRPTEVVEHVTRHVPAFRLSFAPDPSFVEVLREIR